MTVSLRNDPEALSEGNATKVALMAKDFLFKAI